MRELVWQGVEEPRMEIAHLEPDWAGERARGTQIGLEYELLYELDGTLLRVEVVGAAARTIELGDADFFDLGLSPLFNSLPVLRDGLLAAGPARDYVMTWVDVPSLTATRAEQRYTPLGGRVVRYASSGFTAEIEFDAEGFVLHYPGLARRVVAMHENPR